MLYTVEDLSVKFNVSKVTIYSKLKLEHIRPLTLKEDGKTKVKEEALNLIKESLNIKDEVNEETSNTSFLNESLINSLNSQIEFLREQLKVKDSQIERNDKLLENMQVLLKQEQDNHKKELLLEEHFKNLDEKLIYLMRTKEPKKGFLKKIFKAEK